MNGRVFFMPFVSMKEIPKYLAASDIIVLPFLYEATVSRSLLEAMAMGKAIVTSNLGEPPLILQNKKDALIVEPTKEKIAEAILFLLSNSKFRNYLGRNARIKILKKYSFNKVIKKTISLYNSLLPS